MYADEICLSFGWDLAHCGCNMAQYGCSMNGPFVNVKWFRVDAMWIILVVLLFNMNLIRILVDYNMVECGWMHS